MEPRLEKALIETLLLILEANVRTAKALETIASAYEPIDGEVLEATVIPFLMSDD